jgi:hypothetical protein
MTHTLHREGIREHDPNDYVFLAMVEGNDERKQDRLAEVFRVVLKHKPINHTGKQNFPDLSDEQFVQIYRRIKIGMAVFDNRDAVLNLLKEIRDKELGVSVVISGLFSRIHEDCGKLGLSMHTVNYSLGKWGKEELLPDPKITQITTMCGHGLISFNLVQSLLKEIRRGKKTVDEASKILAKPCVCGVFNTRRSAELLQALL